MRCALERRRDLEAARLETHDARLARDCAIAAAPDPTSTTCGRVIRKFPNAAAYETAASARNELAGAYELNCTSIRRTQVQAELVTGAPRLRLRHAPASRHWATGLWASSADHARCTRRPRDRVPSQGLGSELIPYSGQIPLAQKSNCPALRQSALIHCLPRPARTHSAGSAARYCTPHAATTAALPACRPVAQTRNTTRPLHARTHTRTRITSSSFTPSSPS